MELLGSGADHLGPRLPGASGQLKLEEGPAAQHKGAPPRPGGRRWAWLLGGGCLGGPRPRAVHSLGGSGGEGAPAGLRRCGQPSCDGEGGGGGAEAGGEAAQLQPPQPSFQDLPEGILGLVLARLAQSSRATHFNVWCVGGRRRLRSGRGLFRARTRRWRRRRFSCSRPSRMRRVCRAASCLKRCAVHPAAALVQSMHAHPRPHRAPSTPQCCVPRVAGAGARALLWLALGGAPPHLPPRPALLPGEGRGGARRGLVEGSAPRFAAGSAAPPQTVISSQRQTPKLAAGAALQQGMAQPGRALHHCCCCCCVRGEARKARMRCRASAEPAPRGEPHRPPQVLCSARQPAQLRRRGPQVGAAGRGAPPALGAGVSQRTMQKSLLKSRA